MVVKQRLSCQFHLEELKGVDLPVIKVDGATPVVLDMPAECGEDHPDVTPRHLHSIHVALDETKHRTEKKIEEQLISMMNTVWRILHLTDSITYCIYLAIWNSRPNYRVKFSSAW